MGKLGISVPPKKWKKPCIKITKTYLGSFREKILHLKSKNSSIWKSILIEEWSTFKIKMFKHLPPITVLSKRVDPKHLLGSKQKETQTKPNFHWDWWKQSSTSKLITFLTIKANWSILKILQWGIFIFEGKKKIVLKLFMNLVWFKHEVSNPMLQLYKL